MNSVKKSGKQKGGKKAREGERGLVCSRRQLVDIGHWDERNRERDRQKRMQRLKRNEEEEKKQNLMQKDEKKVGKKKKEEGRVKKKQKNKSKVF